MTPRRIQRKRTPGWRKPEGCVNVTRPGRWGNPYAVKRVGDVWIVVGPDGPRGPAYDNENAAKSLAVMVFEVSLEYKLAADPHLLDELRGKDLACWCASGDPCHAGVLIKHANNKEGK